MPLSARSRLLFAALAGLVLLALAAAASQLPLQVAGLIDRAPDPLVVAEAIVSSAPIPLMDPDLREISGIVPRASAAGTLWALSDGGNPAALYAIDTTGRVVQRVAISDATNIDWEALSAGPCGARRCLYIGDIGDNRSGRAFVTIYRIDEPTADATSAAARRLDVRWPIGPDDIEAMAGDAGGALWFITKGRDWGKVHLLRVGADAWNSHSCAARDEAPCPAGAFVGEQIARFRLPAGNSGEFITDAAIASDGALFLRSYDDVLRLLPASRGWSVANGARCRLGGLQQQGEGLAMLDDGRLVLATEETRQSAAALQIIRCPAGENRR